MQGVVLRAVQAWWKQDVSALDERAWSTQVASMERVKGSSGRVDSEREAKTA
jgi:hypothetical protein